MTTTVMTPRPRANAAPTLERAEPLSPLERAQRALDWEHAAQVQLMGAAADFGLAHPAVESMVPGAGTGGRDRVDGIPEVDELAAAEFGAHTGLGAVGASSLIRDALALKFRLPLLWKRVQSAEVDVWRARRIAVACRGLSSGAAAEVDLRLRRCAHSIGAARLERLVTVVALEWGEVDRLPQGACPQRLNVVPLTNGSGLSWIDGCADAGDARLFEQAVGQVARRLGEQGDERELDARRAAALGIMADPRRHAALLEGRPDSPESLPTLVLNVTLTDRALREGSREDRPAGSASAGSGFATSHAPAVADAGPLGPQLAELVRQWAGHSRVSVNPVADAEAPPVDAYHVPVGMRRALEQRHTTCVFPHCGQLSSECDADHIEPFRPGVRGQTSLRNLAPLCRRHHRLKTHRGWEYRRLGPSTYLWTSPDGAQWVTGADGTHTITGRRRRQVSAVPQVPRRRVLPPRAPSSRHLRAPRTTGPPTPHVGDDPPPF